jgi:hypothetical protein
MTNIGARNERPPLWEVVRDEAVVGPFQTALHELSALAILQWDAEEFTSLSAEDGTSHSLANGFLRAYDAIEMQDIEGTPHVIATRALQDAILRHYPFFSAVKAEIGKRDSGFSLQKALSHIPEKGIN